MGEKLERLMALMLPLRKTRFISECRSYWLVPPFLEGEGREVVFEALKARHPEIAQHCYEFERCFDMKIDPVLEAFCEENENAKLLLDFYHKSTVKEKPIHLIHAKLL